MATEVTPVEGDELDDEVRPKRTSGRVSYDAGLGASCMIWAVAIGLALLIGVELVWGLAHIDAISR